MTTTPLPLLAPADSDAYPPLSALNDLLFCPRRCALHRLEGIWTDNVHTTAGSLDHRKVHRERDSAEAPVRTARGLPVISHRLRLVGVADLVEFHPTETGRPDQPYPVEYKRGRRRRWDNDEVQVCAQALCLEEMLGVAIPAGAIFHIRSKRRCEVAFDAGLRQATCQAAERLHLLLAAGVTPPPVLHPKCKQCSVQHLCLPDLLARPQTYHRAAAQLFTVPT
jgi:CRISPR-associated exonuclease Cas4